MLKTRLEARQTPFWRGLGLPWVALGRHLAGFWALLGGSWPLWGASWAPLGHFLGAFGWSSALLGRILPPWSAPGLDFGGLGTCRAGFWKASGSCFGLPFAALCVLLHDAFIYAETKLFHLLALFLLPFWCGSLCAAHPPPPEGMPSGPNTSYKLPNIALKAFLNYQKPSFKGLSQVKA